MPVAFRLALFLAVITALPAGAAEIKILVAGAMKAVVVELAPAFENTTGHKLVIANDTAGGLTTRIKGGEAFDVAIITPAAIDSLIEGKRIAPGSRVNLAKVGIGVAVRAGAPRPDIATVDAFKATLLAAKSVAYIDPKAGGSSGIYFDQLIDKLGIAAPVRAKARLMPGGYVAELVAKGDVEMAVHQISEIVPVAGVDLVGPLPPEIQNITVYAGGLSPTPTDAAAAKALLAHLASDAAKPVLAKKGME